MNEKGVFQDQVFRIAFEHTPDIILILRPDGYILDANRAAVRAYGYSYEELTQLRIHDLRIDADKTIVDAQLEQANWHTYQFETIHRCKDGALLPVEISAHGQLADGQRVLFSIIRDISKRKQVEDQLRYLATHDALTGIPNRYSFEQTLQHAVTKAERGIVSSLLFIDLDNFKLVNDTFGHAVGDQLLINVTNIIRLALRKTDVLARIGGDEFAVLLDSVTMREAIIVAEKLRAAIEDEEICLNMYGAYYKLTLSIGIVEVDGSCPSYQLLSHADRALYLAKGNGKNCIKVG